MKRAVLLLTAMMLTLVVGGGVALAVVKTGTDGQDFLMGTGDDDVIYGEGGIDFVDGRKRKTSSSAGAAETQWW